MSYVKQDLIRPHAVLFVLCQYFSEVSFGFLSIVECLQGLMNAFITSHLHIPKLFVPSNFTASIFIGCGFKDFTVDWLSPAIFLIDCLTQYGKQLVKINSNRKDQIFTFERNCRQSTNWFAPPEQKNSLSNSESSDTTCWKSTRQRRWPPENSHQTTRTIK